MGRVLEGAGERGRGGGVEGRVLEGGKVGEGVVLEGAGGGGVRRRHG